MAQYLVQFIADPPRFEVVKDGTYATGVDLDQNGGSLAYWRAAKSLRARVIGRMEDPNPVFAAPSDVPEALALAEMLNE